MTSDIARGAATEGVVAWKRSDHLPFGQRLYSNPETAAWISGKVPVRPAPPDTPLSPAAASAPWIPEKFLSDLIDGHDFAETGRYMSVSERLRRLYGIFLYFHRLRDGLIIPSRYRYPVGALVRMENDGPTAIRLAWAKAIWANLPENDSDIFARTATTESPRNKHLAGSLDMLLSWGRMRDPLPLAGTNWMQPDNDNYSDDDGPNPRPASNRERRIRPGSSGAELQSFINKAGPCTVRKHAKLGGGGAWEVMPKDITIQLVPDKTDKAGKVTKSHRAIVRAGRLRIANGETSQGDFRVEEGTILHQPDRFGEMLGPEPDTAEKVRSASYWASLFKVDRETVVETDEHGDERVRFIKAGKMRRKVLLTAEDQQALLAGPLPPITKCPDGLPLGSEDIGAQFVGGWISNPKGTTTPERWEDIADEMARRVEFERWVADLPPEQVKALNLATTAANLQQIGEAFGKTDKNAERYGKKILIAANENLKKIAAA